MFELESDGIRLFWIAQLLKLVLVGSMFALAAWLVSTLSLKVGYARKLCHFSFFLIPVVIEDALAISRRASTFHVSATVFLLLCVGFSSPIRSRIRFLQLLFLAWDRPEDRPNTVNWLWTQCIGGYLAVIGLIALLSTESAERLIVIPLLINGIGDGLAEPVGLRFGKHRYTTFALCSNEKYFRTLEGSACVFITSCVVLILFRDYFTALQLAILLAVVPFSATITEAKAPHTWDGPLIILVTGLQLYLLLFLRL